MKLYDYLPSGNAYKARWLLSYLGQAYVHVPVDIHAGQTHTPEYLAMNPAGQIPVLELADGRTIAESNAIIAFLAEGSDLVPSDAFDRAKMLQWMFWEQYRHEPAIAVARFIRVYETADRYDDLPGLMERGRTALAVMNGHLAERDWFVGDARSLADIALYAYTHVAEQGGFALGDYPNIGGWLARFADHPHHIRITDTPGSGSAGVDHS